MTGNNNKFLEHQVRKFKTTAYILPIKTGEESTIKLIKLNRLLRLLFKTSCSLTSLCMKHLSYTKVGQSLGTHWPQPWSTVQLLMWQKSQHVRFYLSCKSQSGSQEVQSMRHYTPHKLSQSEHSTQKTLSHWLFQDQLST